MNDKPNLNSESPVFETMESAQESPEKIPDKISYERKIVSCVYETMTLQQVTSDLSLTQRLTKICNISFEQGDIPYLDNFSADTILSIAFDKQDRTAWGLAFAELKTYDVDPKYVSPQQYHVHSIAVHPEARNNGLCKGLTKALVKHCRKQYPKAPIYLNVRVTASNPNIGGIKCYQRNGFRFVGVPPEKRSDGVNYYMVNEPVRQKTRKKSRKQTRRKRR
uniref:N-acetyltransferase domain-containing protein n=1 Tax=viral metagenome TaxID=1070528 RepID=A0A6C0F665_9ZZZZ|tara:strand:+ start:7062 stop:7724 length:663 start_codon:yes stop_codon:yes gene_type:complete